MRRLRVFFAAVKALAGLGVATVARAAGTRRSRRLMMHAATLGLAALGTAALAVPEAHASVRLSHDTSIVSNDSHLFASAEEGWSGTGQFSQGVMRTRAGFPHTAGRHA